ncbi:hypothetical protein BS47DRAFT_1370698 [Hydnum rufescens UP504]|uniref:RNA helicase n=1 Tax=Hydnum rufescens UP504 TaxID=1448309 RepID=A0A9P6B8N3_9AGAM|nr:hypothetical protein BS47DRAFT_1370698 [Hydnum rufescens UP504]
MVDPKLVDLEANFSSAFSKILDSRLLKALADLGFARPTLIQSTAIPLALEGRDILARARTGSGKTAAYCIPVVQKYSRRNRYVINDLLPTKELAEQVTSYLRGLLTYCDKSIVVSNVAAGTSNHLQRILLADVPDIVVATPARVLALAQSKAIVLSFLESLVIDEADLILSYGHDADVRNILSGELLPKVYQSFLMSATMTKDVETLKGLVLRSPAILKLEEEQDEAANLSQYSVRCNEVDKFLLTYVILKLRLVKGKCILFVNDVDRCYRLKLFLEQFSIKSCVLNPELPINSRFHIVQEFNKGVYEYIIASDESATRGENDAPEEEDGQDADDTNEHEGGGDTTDEETSHAPSSTLKRKHDSASPAPPAKQWQGVNDKEYGVSRGVDFVDVACVINFDLPTSSRGYTHRVGRTARAGRSGLAISFIVPPSDWGKHKVVSCPTSKLDEQVFSRIEKEQGARGSKIKEYQFDMKQVEAFRYRMEDALRAVTRVAIKEARVKELKTELLNSDKLKAHFEDNPLDLEYLRHDKPLHPTRVQSHMRHVPKYLIPRVAPVAVQDNVELVAPLNPTTEKSNVGFVPFRKDTTRRGKVRGRGGKPGGRGGGGGRKKDPLKQFGA